MNYSIKSLIRDSLIIGVLIFIFRKIISSIYLTFTENFDNFDQNKFKTECCKGIIKYSSSNGCACENKLNDNFYNINSNTLSY